MKEVMVHAGKTNVWFILNERQEGGLKAKVPMPSYLYNSYPPPPPKKKKKRNRRLKQSKALNHGWNLMDDSIGTRSNCFRSKRVVGIFGKEGGFFFWDENYLS